MVPEGLNPRVFALAVIPLAVGFIGFLLRDIVLIAAGLIAAVVAGLLLGLIDFVVRRRRMSRVKRFAPDDILKAGKRNFEIPYSDVINVKLTTFERYDGSSRGLFLPTLPELAHDIEFVTTRGSYVFILSKSDLDRCRELLNTKIPEKIEKNGSEEY
jgi:hypothetical protein